VSAAARVSAGVTVEADRAGDDARELELKYAVGDLDAVHELVGGATVAGLQAGPWRSVPVVDQYLDTRSRALARAGYGARLRRIGRRTLVTVKSAASRGRRSGRGACPGVGRRGLHDRLEIEARATRRLDPARWPQSAARALIETAAGGEALHTLFVLDQQRDERDLTRDGTLVARLSLDRGTVLRFGRPLGEIQMLEVEAAASSAAGRASLEAIADILDASPELRPEQRSKEELALALIDHAHGATRAGRAPRTPGLTADDPLAEAGRKVLRMHLLRMLAAEPGVRTGDIEAVHKMRVATRRMRAAWRVFNGAYRARLQRRYVDELRTVAGALGAVRDLDVQLERLAVFRAGLSDQTAAAALAPLTDEWQRRRAAAHSTLLDLLASPAYDQFIADYRAFVETPGAGSAAGSADRVGDVAAGRTWRAFERLRAHDQIVPFADVVALHALRIDGKRLRYTLEFLREILPVTADRLVADIVALQDHVGLLNDAQIAADSTRAWLVGGSAGLSPAQRQAAAGYLRSCEADVARMRRTFKPLWRRLTAPTFRRRLALALGAI
jgi:CHAD domain-containing protein